MSQGVLENLVEELSKLPGIGAKSAERLAYHLLKIPNAQALSLSKAIENLKLSVHPCKQCFHIAEADLCDICQKPNRNEKLICVVEQPKDVHAIEATGRFHGLYHVLGGSFSPMEDRGPKSLSIAALEKRIKEQGVEEVIVATNPDFEGDGTALLLAETLQASSVKMSRLARGVPTGSQIEYMNSSIIGDALEGRQQYGQ